jgi:hypothetical protein
MARGERSFLLAENCGEKSVKTWEKAPLEYLSSITTEKAQFEHLSHTTREKAPFEYLSRITREDST